jgi:hypothetical protein
LAWITGDDVTKDYSFYQDVRNSLPSPAFKRFPEDPVLKNEEKTKFWHEIRSADTPLCIVCGYPQFLKINQLGVFDFLDPQQIVFGYTQAKDDDQQTDVTFVKLTESYVWKDLHHVNVRKEMKVEIQLHKKEQCVSTVDVIGQTCLFGVGDPPKPKYYTIVDSQNSCIILVVQCTNNTEFEQIQSSKYYIPSEATWSGSIGKAHFDALKKMSSVKHWQYVSLGCTAMNPIIALVNYFRNNLTSQ